MIWHESLPPPYIDLTTPMGRGFMAMISAMAEDERLRIIKRTHEGRKIAQAKGVRMGRMCFSTQARPLLEWSAIHWNRT
jgi:DNA invertase Pin-like site-specific DNA recombinase